MNAQNLFKVAATVNAGSVIGHFLAGFRNVYPALASLDGKYKMGKAGARNSWDNVHVLLLYNAILNWQWSQAVLPFTTVDQVMALSMLVAGLLSSLRYWDSKEYPALFPMFVAPVSAAVAMFLL